MVLDLEGYVIDFDYTNALMVRIEKFKTLFGESKNGSIKGVLEELLAWEREIAKYPTGVSTSRMVRAWLILMEIEMRNFGTVGNRALRKAGFDLPNKIKEAA